MKEQHREMINKQMKKLIAEVEQIPDLTERAKVRVSLIEIMFDIATCDNMVLDTGKEAIKEDKAKEVKIEVEEIDLEQTEEMVENESVQPMVEEVPVETINYENVETSNYILPDFRTLLKKAGKVNTSENKVK